MGKWKNWIIGGLVSLGIYLLWKYFTAGPAAAVDGSAASEGWNVGAMPGYNVSPGLSAPLGTDQPSTVPDPTSTTDTSAPPPPISPPAPLSLGKFPGSTPPPPTFAPVPQDTHAESGLPTTGGLTRGPTSIAPPPPVVSPPAPLAKPTYVKPVTLAPAAVTGPTLETRTGRGHF